MSKNYKNKPNWALTGHKKPVTRREFLNYGMIPFAASAFMPNWLQLFSPERSLAQVGAGCPAAGSNMIPFIQLNLAGGAGLMANYVPMDKDKTRLQVTALWEWEMARFPSFVNLEMSPLLEIVVMVN